ncbi:MAG: transporter substrate-binding domain-containing protein [Caldisericaceae bacterium]
MKLKSFKAVVLFVVIFSMVAVSFVGCKKQPKVLRVGTSADYPPFEYVDDKTQEFVGFDLDLMRLLAKKMGYDDVQILNMDFDTIIPSLGTDKIDVAAACITITPDRENEAIAVPYFTSGQSVIVKKDSSFNPQSLEDLSGKKIGVQKGTTGEETLDKAIADGKVKNAKVMRYTSVILGMMDLQTGAVDAMIIDTPVATLYSTKYDYKTAVEVVSETDGLFVKKGNTALADSLKKALDEVKNSPDWTALMEKYFGAQ